MYMLLMVILANLQLIRNDTYNDDYNLPQVQVDRLTNEEVSKIFYLLDVLFYDNIIISGNHYNSIKKSQKDKN